MAHGDGAQRISAGSVFYNEISVLAHCGIFFRKSKERCAKIVAHAASVLCGPPHAGSHNISRRALLHMYIYCQAP